MYDHKIKIGLKEALICQRSIQGGTLFSIIVNVSTKSVTYRNAQIDVKVVNLIPMPTTHWY